MRRALALTLALALSIRAAPADDQPADFDAELKALTAAYTQAVQDFMKPYQEAKTKEERAKVNLDWQKHPVREYLPKFQALALRAAKTPAGLHAHLWILQNAGQMSGEANAAMADSVRQVLDLYLQSPELEGFAATMNNLRWYIPKEAQAALRRLIAESPHHGVLAAARFSLAVMLLGRGGASPQELAESKGLFDSLAKDFADTRYAKQAERYVFEAEHLQIGMTAPEFEAIDQDGKPFKLSDYRGKVVVLDFWGFW